MIFFLAGSQVKYLTLHSRCMIICFCSGIFLLNFMTNTYIWFLFLAGPQMRYMASFNGDM